MIKKFKSLGFEAVVGLILGFAAGYFIGWWTLPLATAVASFYFKTPTGLAFAAGTMAGTLLWASFAGYLDFLNGGQLSTMLAETFQLSNGGILVTLTGLLGGLLGGFGAMTGSLARKVIYPTP